LPGSDSELVDLTMVFFGVEAMKLAIAGGQRLLNDELLQLVNELCSPAVRNIH